MPSFSMQILDNLVEQINVTHKEFSENWLSNQDAKTNFKKTRIDHIVNDERFIALDFLETISNYYSELVMLFSTLDYEFDYADYEVRMRVKQKDSIVNKLIQYRIDHEEGRIAINKCLNDMLGIRILFSDLDHNSVEFNDCLDVIREKHCVEVIPRDKDGYLATHIYFKNQNNFKLPWELQIWSKDNENNNMNLHKDHKSKRKYTSWPEIYKENTAFERSETT